MVRILLADDQQIVRAGFHRLLNAEESFDVVGEVSSVADLVSSVPRLRPDVVLVELSLPDGGCLEALQRLPRRPGQRPAAAPVVLTMHSLEPDVISAFAAGALGFVLKSDPVPSLFNAILAAAAGQPYACPAALEYLIRSAVIHQVAQPPAEPAGQGHAHRLTKRQRDVLSLISAGLSNAEIADVLTVSEGTVKTHVSDILTKLKLQSRQQAMVFAFRNGLIKTAS